MEDMNSDTIVNPQLELKTYKQKLLRHPMRRYIGKVYDINYRGRHTAVVVGFNLPMKNWRLLPLSGISYQADSDPYSKQMGLVVAMLNACNRAKGYLVE